MHLKQKGWNGVEGFLGMLKLKLQLEDEDPRDGWCNSIGGKDWGWDEGKQSTVAKPWREQPKKKEDIEEVWGKWEWIRTVFQGRDGGWGGGGWLTGNGRCRVKLKKEQDGAMKLGRGSDYLSVWEPRKARDLRMWRWGMMKSPEM